MGALPKLTVLLGALLLATSCTRLHIDPNHGAESVYLRTLDHSELYELRYLRPARLGPLRQDFTALTLCWFVPVNHPDFGQWLDATLPEGADAANLRASVRTPWYGHLLFFPTLGLIRMERVRFEADPVQIRLLVPHEGDDHGIRMVERNP